MRLIRWTQRLALLAVGGVAALQPISAEGLWWQLARGRAAWQGSLTPSASLLVRETRAEADWLGGLPLYVIYQGGGSAGWMLCRLAVVSVLLLAAADFFRSRRILAPRSVLLIAFALLALAGSLDPVPRLFDLLGILFVAWWSWPAFARSLFAGASFAGERRRPRRLASSLTVAAVFWSWANLAPAVAVGAGLLLIAAIGATLAGRNAMIRRWLALLVAVAAGSLNPRGVWVWSDSLLACMPSWLTPPVALEGTPWEALPAAAWGFREWTFLGLTLVWIANRLVLARRRSRPQGAVLAAGGDAKEPSGRLDSRRRPDGLFLIELLPFAGIQWLAWSSRQNVSLAIVWLAADLAFQWRAVGWWTFAEASVKGGARRKRFAALASVLLIGCALPASGLTRSLGWGISVSLDPRLMRMALAKTRPSGTALADDLRSGGMLAWLLPELPRPVAPA